MADTKSYVVFDTGLQMNTKYLTEPVAYFLGEIYAAEEYVVSNGVRYMVAPVRYNYSAATELEIAEHFELVKALARTVNGQTVMRENIVHTSLDSGKNRMPGFSTFFRVKTLEKMNDLIPTLRQALSDSPWNVQRAFLVGIFDGRSSADIDKKTQKVRMLSLDCITDEVSSFLSDMVEESGIRYNYNTHRDRLEGGKPRNPQLRIRDVDEFMRRVGLISPRKIKLLKNAYDHNYSYVEVGDASEVLPGLKTIIVR